MAENEPEVQTWVKLDPPPTACKAYASGTCCFDLHFDPREKMPHMEAIACGKSDPIWATTPNAKQVNCQECLELIHS